MTTGARKAKATTRTLLLLRMGPPVMRALYVGLATLSCGSGKDTRAAGWQRTQAYRDEKQPFEAQGKHAVPPTSAGSGLCLLLLHGGVHLLHHFAHGGV